jgi:hypothetical protein
MSPKGGARHQDDFDFDNCLTVTEIWSWALEGA